MKRDTFQHENPETRDSIDRGSWWAPSKARGDRWPLVVALLIAFPVLVIFAHAMSRARETGDTREVLVAYLVAIGAIMALLVAVAFVVRKVRELKARREQHLWQGSTVAGDHADAWFDPNEPDGKRKPREFPVGPGLSLHEHHQHSGPTPKRRI